MLDDLLIVPEDTVPIYQQLEQQLLRFIRAGRLRPGEELPSVRIIAAAIAVNPMTVSKTINRLVDQGWLERRRGKPTCVADPLPDSENIAEGALQKDIARLVTHCKQLEISESQLKELIQRHWNEEKK